MFFLTSRSKREKMVDLVDFKGQLTVIIASLHHHLDNNQLTLLLLSKGLHDMCTYSGVIIISLPAGDKYDHIQFLIIIQSFHTSMLTSLLLS